MKKKVIFAAILLLLLTLGSVGSIYIYTQKNDAHIARIYQNGECIQSIDLSQVADSYTFTVEGLDGASNTIEVRPGEIGVIEASCPDKVCVHMGFIKNDRLPISCLPNKLMIQIESTVKIDNTIDAIVR